LSWTGLSESYLKNNTEKQLFLVSDSGPSWHFCFEVVIGDENCENN
jgi:hypothetical protein